MAHRCRPLIPRWVCGPHIIIAFIKKNKYKNVNKKKYIEMTPLNYKICTRRKASTTEIIYVHYTTTINVYCFVGTTVCRFLVVRKTSLTAYEVLYCLRRFFLCSTDGWRACSDVVFNIQNRRSDGDRVSIRYGRENQ